MLPYWIIAGIFSITAFCNKRTNYQAWIPYAFFTILYGLRGAVGTDWQAYLLYFNNINNKSYVEGRGFEPGYYVLNRIFAFLHVNYWTLLFVICIFTGVMFYKSVKRMTMNAGIAIITGLYFFFLPCVEATRESISLVLFFYSLPYLLTDRKEMPNVKKAGIINKVQALVASNDGKYILLNLIGVLFHRTAIFALIFYLFYRFNTFKIVIPIFFFSFTALQPIIEKILSYNYAYYIRYKIYVGDSIQKISNFHLSPRIFEYIILILALLYFYRRTIQCKDWIEPIDHKRAEMLVACLLAIGVLLNICFSNMSGIVYRMEYFCDIGAILAYCYIYDYINTQATAFFYTSGVNILMILRIFLRLYNAAETYSFFG